MAIQLSDHFNYNKLLRFTLPSIFMMILVSLYGIVDGLFVSNLVGENAFSAVNVSSAAVYMLSAISHMIGMGGGSVIARTLGERRQKDASRYFTMAVLFGVGLTIILSVLGIIFIEPIMRLAGASDLIMDDCISYSIIILIGMPLCVLQSAFSRFLSVMEKPKLALYISIAAGITNIILDYVFISPNLFDMGIEGAALATILGYAVGGIMPVAYVFKAKKLNIRFVKTKIEWRIIGQTISLGSSAMIANVATGICGIAINNILMNLVGEAGIAAYGVIMYLDFIFLGMFNGFSVGVAPIISFHYGAMNHDELRSLIKKGFTLIAIFAVCSLSIAQLIAQPAAMAFIKTESTLDLTVSGTRLYSLMYLFCGFSILIANLFSALSNGKVSFILSIMRTVLRIVVVFLLTLVMDINGVWLCGLFTDFVVSVISMIWFKADTKRQLSRF